MNGLRNRRTLLAAMLAVCGASSAAATNIDWLNMSPTPFGSPVPNNSVFNLPGVGPVTVTYSIPSTFGHVRFLNPLFQNGSVPGYSWTAQELFGATNYSPDPLGTANWSITYTFAGTIPAGTLFVGVSGLGRTTSYGGLASTATVNQNGLFLGDWTGGGNYGATQFISGVGSFTLQNSVSGPGGQDPWWNTALAVVQILDPVSSLTVYFSQLAGDGVGVNIAAIPEPTTFGLFGLGALLLPRRRR